MSKKSAKIQREKFGWWMPGQVDPGGLFVVRTKDRILQLSRRSLEKYVKNHPEDYVIAAKEVTTGEVKDVTPAWITGSGPLDIFEWRSASRELSEVIESVPPRH